MSRTTLIFPAILLAITPFLMGARSAARDEVPGVDTELVKALALEPLNPPAPEIAVVSRRTGREWPDLSERSASNGPKPPSVANRNANPLNMKLGAATRGYVERGEATVSEIAPLDGGRFLKFHSPHTGFRAAAELLQSGSYRELDLGSVFRRWSNNGFGSEILGGTRLDPRVTVAHLSADQLKILLNAMATAEGYESPTIADEIALALKP